MRATFLSALPYAIELAGEQVLIGSNAPIPIDPPAWRARLFDDRNAGYLGRARVLATWETLGTVTRLQSGLAPAGWINRDLFPRDEFETPGQPSDQETVAKSLRSISLDRKQASRRES